MKKFNFDFGILTFGLLVILSLLFNSLASAQDFKRQYRNAKGLFDDGKYSLAMEAFKPLIVYDKDNPYPEYASFYYAISSYHMGYAAVAKDMLQQIRKLYPDWNQLNEVNYWLAKIYFDQREYFQGMLVLKEVRQESFVVDVTAMKRQYLSQIQDEEILRMALEEHPLDKEVARVLLSVLAKEAFDPKVKREFDSLASLYSFRQDEFQLNLGPVSVKKDRYVVSLLFPFLADELDPSPRQKQNQFVLDLYHGIKMAHDTLTKQGINIDLRMYDTRWSPGNPQSQALKGILESAELKNSDLLVGPLFTDENKLVQEFSKEYKINMINPVSGNSDFVGDNPFALLFQPSFETLGQRAAEIVAERVRNKNCIVYFGETTKDSVMAYSFMQKASELGINIVLAEEHRRETAGAIISTLTTPTEFDEFKNPIQYTLKLDSIGSIFVASDNGLIYTKVNSSVIQRGDSITIVGHENWINGDNTAVNFENVEKLHVLFASPNFYPERNYAFEAFREKFLAQHGQYPTLYTRIGYEFMLFVGQALFRYGTYFQQGLKTNGFWPGYLYHGFDYADGRDNRFVPYVYFKNGELTVLNSLR